jgi:hypothetical protein
MALLAVAFASLVIYGENPKSQSDAHKQNPAHAIQQPDTGTVIVVNQPAPQGPENSHATKPPSYIHELLLPQNVPNIALVIVGIVGIVAALCTLTAIKRQAHEMRRQRHEMVRQRHELTGQRTAMEGQLKAMEGQLAAMQSSGKQTDELIRQSTEQVKHLETSAKAAKDSADIFVLSERAWLQIHITKQPTVQTNRDRTAIEHVWFWPDVMNVGRTPATMTKIIVVTYQIPKPLGNHSQMPPPLPSEPIYDADKDRRVVGIERSAILAPQTGLTPIPIELKGHEFKSITEREMTLYLYGYVEYFDVVGIPHVTRFCEMYWMPFNPNDPNPQGFITAGNTPAAYTECT